MDLLSPVFTISLQNCPRVCPRVCAHVLSSSAVTPADDEAFITSHLVPQRCRGEGDGGGGVTGLLTRRRDICCGGKGGGVKVD